MHVPSMNDYDQRPGHAVHAEEPREFAPRLEQPCSLCLTYSSSIAAFKRRAAAFCIQVGVQTAIN